MGIELVEICSILKDFGNIWNLCHIEWIKLLKSLMENDSRRMQEDTDCTLVFHLTFQLAGTFASQKIELEHGSCEPCIDQNVWSNRQFV